MHDTVSLYIPRPSQVSTSRYIRPSTPKQIMSQTSPASYDVIVIGGGPAGLSAALGLARHVWRVLVIDSGSYRNDVATHMHNVAGWDHVPPSEFRAATRKQILDRYNTVEFADGTEVTGVEKLEEKGFEVIAEDGRRFWGRKLVLATGVRDIMPDLPGYEQSWGSEM